MHSHRNELLYFLECHVNLGNICTTCGKQIILNNQICKHMRDHHLGFAATECRTNSFLEQYICKNDNRVASINEGTL